MKTTIILFFLYTVNAITYEPTWESLDTRPLPSWFDEAKLGIFLHWGVYSVPSFKSEWFWIYWHTGHTDILDFINKNYPPGFTYQEFAQDFTAEFYDPYDWAALFKASGAKYVVLTTKHHEGYTLWPSKHSFSWNSKDVGPNRDLVGDLGKAIRETTDLKFGLYHSLMEWLNPLYLDDQGNNWETDTFVQTKVLPALYELVNNYLPDIIWSDGEWEAPDYYWKSREFLAWLYNESPVKDYVLTNDRWGSNDVVCKHGGYLTCFDGYNPGILQERKWENSMTVDKYSYGFRRNAKIEDYRSIYELLVTFVETVSCGGNMLMNIGPSKEGTIVPIFRERLMQMGEWLNINGEAIYKSKPWIYQQDTIGKTWYTSSESAVYAITLEWPQNNLYQSEKLFELFSNNTAKAYLLGNEGELKWNIGENKVEIQFPDRAIVTSQWVWVVKVENDANMV